MPENRFDYYPLAQAKEEARMVRERRQTVVDPAASPDDLSMIQDTAAATVRYQSYYKP